MIFSKKKNNIITEKSKESLNYDSWINENPVEIEGQLSVDVYQNNENIIIKSTIAGVKPEDLKISLHHDLLTIKGSRHIDQKITDNDCLYQECYWGSFSRSIILPAEVDEHNVEAEIENGVLTITLKKVKPGKIEVKLKD